MKFTAFKNVQNSSVIYFNFLKLLGLYPVFFNHENSPKKFINFATTTFYSTGIFSIFFFVVEMEGKTTVLITQMWRLNLFLGGGIAIFLVIYQYWKYPKILKIFRMTDECDVKVSYHYP